MAVAGGAVAAAALTLPAALSGDPDHSQRKQHSQYYQRDDPAKSQHIHPSISLMQLSAPKYTRFAGKEQQPAAHFFVQGAAAAAARRQCCTTGVRRNIFAARKKVSKKVKVFQIRACISAKAVL